ncbi:MAG: hypothetical protein P4N59_33675 [Negativicutes bacterium]|nr:hypothetical protein [Negativicutes bacterium]
MATHYFAHHLLNRGILSAAQMQEVLDYERSVRVKLGVLAINAGFMTASQVEEVHALQRTQDKQFGAIAVGEGYLTGAQLDDLLTAQGRRHFAFIQAIADKGFLTLAELEKIVADYRRDNNISEEEWAAQDDATPEEMIRGLLTFPQADESSELFYKYAGLLLRNIVRFLGDNPVVLTSNYAEPESKEQWLVTQTIFGGVALEVALAMESPVLLELARRFSGENLAEIDELAIDSAGEFLNMNNGVFSSNLSHDGIEADLLPQQVQLPANIDRGTAWRLSIGLTFGRLDLFIAQTT